MGRTGTADHRVVRANPIQGVRRPTRSRLSTRMRRIAVLVAVVALAASCASDAPPEAVADSASPPVVAGDEAPPTGGTETDAADGAASAGTGQDSAPDPSAAAGAGQDSAPDASETAAASGTETSSSETSEPTAAQDASDSTAPTATSGPLRTEPGGRHFVDRNGRAVLLVGSHTWITLEEWGDSADAIPPFDFDGYLDYLVANHHNFFRLWTWEQFQGVPWMSEPLYLAPNPYLRTGPGQAGDGLPAFDLDRFDQRYFDRLRDRVEAARDRGIYVAVMLFNGWSIDDKEGLPGNPCPGHPFFAGNNVNGMSADANGDGLCTELHTLADPEVTERQEAYVRKVVETVGDFDNVLYEVSNESPSGSDDWQRHMMEYVRQVEGDRPLRHPVGLTVEYPNGDNGELFASTADWVSPNADGGYQSDPPVADGSKVIALDTDHLWGVGGDGGWVWRAVTRGHNVLYMDCYDFVATGCEGDPGDRDRLSAIASMGAARRLVDQVDLRESVPEPSRCSSGYCLVDSTGAARSAVVFVPGGGAVELDLGPVRSVRYRWVDAAWSESDAPTTPVETIDEPAGTLVLESPFAGDSALLVLAAAA